jgi:cytochrome c553
MLSTYSRLLCKLTAVLAALCLTQMASAEADAERGKVLADTCKGCHAVDSYNNVYPTYHVPKVAGQNAGYLASALTLYRDGARLPEALTFLQRFRCGSTSGMWSSR